MKYNPKPVAYDLCAFMRKILILLMVPVVFLMAGTAFSLEVDSPTVGSGDQVETHGPNPDHVAAINRVADYLDKMGRKDVGDKLRADFKSGRVYIAKIGANAEINAGILGLGRSLALSDTIINHNSSEESEANEKEAAGWSLTVIHEYVHMNQWVPMEVSVQETPAWGATLKENGQWIRKTIDKIGQTGSDTSLTPQDRAERLKELSQTLTGLQSNFKVMLNEIRDKVAKGGLNGDNEWQGVPPVGSREAKGTTDIDAIEKDADEQIQAGEQVVGQYVARPYVKIDPPPGTVKVGEQVQLAVKLYNMPEGYQARYVWKVLHEGQEAMKESYAESLSCTIDKPGTWTVRVLVKAKGKDNLMIKGKGGYDWLEDTITIMTQPPLVEIDPRPSTAKAGDTIQLAAKLYNLPAGHLAPHYSWTISRDNNEIAWSKDENLSYVVDKPGQWAMRILVQVKNEDNSEIKSPTGDKWLQDTITIKVEEAPAAPAVPPQESTPPESIPQDPKAGMAEIVGVWTGTFGDEEAQFDMTLTFGADGKVSVYGPLEYMQRMDPQNDAENVYGHVYDAKKAVPFSCSGNTVSVTTAVLSTGTHSGRSLKTGKVYPTTVTPVSFSLNGTMAGGTARGKFSVSKPLPWKTKDWVLTFTWQATKRGK
ncbi:MAG: hypothetical protein A2351_08220 [Omnitrophica bacterium RIFOXYB12_FULL_50_7]|nr:MAG: hypothetical protein A2351_08220 [Omnitrophica bacterium RIFOXYB12_FULL_50_7]